MNTTESRSTAFDRATAVVGHLDHPLYDDEHQRDVWNEASAVGYQAATWSLLVAATAAVWLGGEAAMPYAATMTMIAGGAAVLVMTYAQRRGVDAWHSPGTGWLRSTMGGLVILLLLIGTVRTHDISAESSEIAASVAGGIVGSGSVLLLIALAMSVARRRAPRGED